MTAREVWIGVVSLLPDGERFALAWVRRADEWLADAGTAPRGDEIAALARMYRAATASREAPAALNVRARAHADALRALLGDAPPIEAGFDAIAQALSDAAAAAIDISYEASAILDGRAYDPDRGPDPAAWLAIPEDERRANIRLAHVGATDLDDRELRAHANMHDTVETQLASDDPPEIAAALARLTSSGVPRHDAIHAIAGAFMAEMRRVLTSGQPFDMDRYAAALDALPGPR